MAEWTHPKDALPNLGCVVDFATERSIFRGVYVDRRILHIMGNTPIIVRWRYSG